MKRYKAYKKTYSPNDKVYVLVYYESFDGSIFTMRIAENTVKRKSNYKSSPYIVLKFDNYGGVFCRLPEWLAPRTPEGKRFLQQRAKKIIEGKISNMKKEASKKENNYRNAIKALNK
jgi:hypothetical protein